MMSCAPGCRLYYINDGRCHAECRVPECGNDGTDCDREVVEHVPPPPECAPGCTYSMIHNDACDLACNVEDCGYDSLMCLPGALQNSTGEGRATAACDPTECPPFSIGDGHCDLRCYNEGCRYDGGDCVAERWRLDEAKGGVVWRGTGSVGRLARRMLLFVGGLLPPSTGK